ncbi:MAG: hypothetical protein EA376_03180 [Phycisphaeraceae bacterium]|nr:MAG: hypothetical protein EA376_03180 [Phycisphaeraceae bacterium]
MFVPRDLRESGLIPSSRTDGGVWRILACAAAVFVGAAVFSFSADSARASATNLRVDGARGDNAQPLILRGVPRADGDIETQTAPPFRGVENVEFLYGQSVVADDMGVGPNQLLAIASACRFGVTAADDFELEQDALLTGITWEGVYFGAATSFPGEDHAIRITIYSDNGSGNVDEPLLDFQATDVVKVLHPREPIFDVHPVYTFHAELPEPFHIRAGDRYWLSINVDPTGNSSGISFGWAASNQGNATHTPENDQPLHATNVGCESLLDANFVPGGALGLNADLAFGLYGGCPTNDCNCDGVPDDVVIAQGLDTDCNNSGRPDQCDIASGFSTDCNNNGIPDECEIETEYVAFTEKMGPIGSGISQSFVIGGVPVATGDVDLTIAATGNLGSTRRYLNVLLNGNYFTRVFVNTGTNCPSTPNLQQVQIPSSIFNALASRGPIVVTLSPASPVSATACPGSSVSAWIRYDLADTNDCNGSGRLDACDIASGFSTDCTGTGVPDECETTLLMIEHGPSLGQIGHGAPRTQMLRDAPDAVGVVDIVVIARGNFGNATQWLDVFLNDVFVGRLFEHDGQHCQEPEIGFISVPASLFNNVKTGADVEIKLVASPQVSANLCGSTGFVTVSAQYMALNPGADSLCVQLGDINGDGVVNAQDLAILLGAWGTNYPPADLDGNGIVDTADLAILLSVIGGS